MPTSVQENYLARVHTVLQAAATAAATRVDRGRPDAYAPEEVPCINVRRSAGQHSAYGTVADQVVHEFDLDCMVRGDDWETTADSLHMQAHAALLADAPLATLGRGLRCIRTGTSADPGDQTLGRITATYQAQALVRVADLTRAVS